jgi:hypothetical protein
MYDCLEQLWLQRNTFYPTNLSLLVVVRVLTLNIVCIFEHQELEIPCTTSDPPILKSLKHNYTLQNKHQKSYNLNQDPMLLHLLFHKLPSFRDCKSATHGVQNVKTNVFDYGRCKLPIVVLLLFLSILQTVAHNLKHCTFNFSMLLSARIICTLNERLGLEKQHYIKQRF